MQDWRRENMIMWTRHRFGVRFRWLMIPAIKHVLGALLCCSLMAPTLAATGETTPVGLGGARPNFVFILADDLDALTTPLWSALPRTQELLQARGITFDQAFAPTPICCAARASILTGSYGHNTGVLTNGGDFGGWDTFFSNGQESRTFPLYLQNAGYETALIGKYMNGLEADELHVPPGWSEWIVGTNIDFYTGYDYTLNENGVLVSYGDAPSDYSTDVLAGFAVDFVQRVAGSDKAPFFLYFAPTAPHLPLPPAPRHADHPFRDAKAPQRPNFNESDLSDKPRWLRLSGESRKRSVNNWNDTDFSNRMGSLYALDEAVAAIVDALSQQGVLENTYLIFTSDNGYNLGAHRLLHKMAPYEESIQIPLVIAGPGITPRHESRQALHIDFAPTFLALAGIPIPPDIDGRSLVPLLDPASQDPWRRDFIVQYHGGDVFEGIGAELPPAFLYLGSGLDVPTYRAVRETQYTYIEWYDALGGYHDYELYDRVSDPFQLKNLIGTLRGQLQYRSVVSSLRERLDALEACQGLSCRN